MTTEKQKEKQIQQKKKYRNVEGKPLPIVFDYVLPIRQSSPFFSFFFFFCFSFQLALNSHPYRLVAFIIKRREPPCSSPYLFTFFFLLLAKNKSLFSSSLKWIYNFKQICFPAKLAANEQLQKCFFGYSWYRPLFRLRVLFVIKFLTNLFSFLSFVIFFFPIFINFLLTSRKAPFFFFFYVEPQFLTQWSWRLLLGHSVTRISPFTGPREKATFLFLGEARNWLFGFHSFWR